MGTLSQAAWLTAGFEALAAGGVEALRVEPLAERLGVTKGSFYHHFANRRALHDALLDAWERRGTTEIIDHVDAAASTPTERLRHLAHRTMRSEPTSDAIENAIRAWAANDEAAAATIGRVDERRVEYAATLLRATGMSAARARRRARLLYRILIGEFVWRSSGGPTATRAEIDDAVNLVLA
jgi:AcrR family transcriptional regulator